MVNGMSAANVLMITSDANVLRDGTAARSKIEEYSRLSKRLIVIVLNHGRDRYEHGVCGRGSRVFEIMF